MNKNCPRVMMAQMPRIARARQFVFLVFTLQKRASFVQASDCCIHRGDKSSSKGNKLFLSLVDPELFKQNS